MLTISLIQSDIHWEDTAANLAMFSQKIVDLKKHSHIILLPEMFNTGFSLKSTHLAETMEGETVSWMKTMAAKQKVIVAGSLMVKEDEKIYNRLVWALPNGVTYHYDKRHTFSYVDEDKVITAGDKRLIVSVNGWKLNLQICYDVRFPVWARQSYGPEPEYDVLVYIASWPEKRSRAWKALLVARAIENQCYVIGVNRVGTDGEGLYYKGDSMVVSPIGEVLYHQQDVEDVFTITLEKSVLNALRIKYPFLLDGDNFGLRHL